MKDWLIGLEWTGDWEDDAEMAVDGVTRMDGADEDDELGFGFLFEALLTDGLNGSVLAELLLILLAELDGGLAELSSCNRLCSATTSGFELLDLKVVDEDAFDAF